MSVKTVTLKSGESYTIEPNLKSMRIFIDAMASIGALDSDEIDVDTTKLMGLIFGKLGPVVEACAKPEVTVDSLSLDDYTLLANATLKAHIDFLSSMAGSITL